MRHEMQWPVIGGGGGGGGGGVGGRSFLGYLKFVSYSPQLLEAPPRRARRGGITHLRQLKEKKGTSQIAN